MTDQTAPTVMERHTLEEIFEKYSFGAVMGSLIAASQHRAKLARQEGNEVEFEFYSAAAEGFRAMSLKIELARVAGVFGHEGVAPPPLPR